MKKQRIQTVNFIYSILTLLILQFSYGCNNTKNAVKQDASKLKDASTIKDAQFDSSMTATPRCIEHWPKNPKASPQPSLRGVGEPKVLWRKKFPALSQPNEPPALAGDRLGILIGNKLWILDRVTGEVVGKATSSGDYMQYDVIADTEGNFYFGTGGSIISLSSEGKLRWPRGANIYDKELSECPYKNNILLSPNGILYHASTDGYLYAQHSEDGSTLWKKKIGVFSEDRALYARGGVGDTFYVSGVPYETSGGKADSQFSVNGTTVSVGYAAYSGGLIAYPPSKELGAELYFSLQYFDKCGKLIWSLPSTSDTSWFVELIGFNEELLVDGYSTKDREKTYIYSKSGKRLSGPIMVRGFPTTLGGDNTIYYTYCERIDVGNVNTVHSEEKRLYLVAYSWKLEELWSLDLGIDGCTSSSTAIADDGVLYLTRESVDDDRIINSVEVIAVQTASPGLANTAYPTRANNNRRTGWLGER